MYKYFLHHIGLWRLTVFAFYQCGWAAFSTIGPVWLNFWSAANAAGSPRNSYHLGVYAALQTLALIFLALFAGHTLTSVAVKAGTELHCVILKTLMAAPMSFFSTVDAGTTTNRFSQDIILVDGDLPMALLETVSAGLVALVQLILVAVAAPYVAIAYPFVVGILYVVQRFYLRTSRQLRFLDLEAKSPLYTHFMETIEGLATIRAFGWSDANIAINHNLLDESQRPLYLLYMVQRWLQLVLDLLTAIITIVLVAIAIKIGSTSSGFVGVALINLMSINQELKMIVINWTSLETSLGAITRIKSFEENTPVEHLPGEDQIPPTEWPHTGDIYIESISGYHDVTQPEHYAFKNVSISITGGEKIAICGRSGSGKSSLLMALARMIELTTGTIIIDNLDLSTLERAAVRSQLTIVPQEPYLFNTSVSQNLDPSGKSSYQAMRTTLEKVRLWDSIEAAGGIDAVLNMDSLSQGQKQLFGLARAILRPSQVVLFDEATSSVDKLTDEVIQRTIRAELRGKTIVAVAHRLETIMDFDRVMVMQAGELIECGTPSQLLGTDSAFKMLCNLQGI